MSIVFEDTEVNIIEDKEIISTEFDIKNDILITRKKMNKTITSNIYSYDDGISLYLKFDDSGPQELINIMFAVFSAKVEKKVCSISKTSDAIVKRLDETHFHVIIKDETNDCGILIFVTIDKKGNTFIVNLNYTKLVNYEIVLNRWVLVNFYEKSGENKEYRTMSIYDLSGKVVKTLFDEKVDISEDYELVLETWPNNKLCAVAYLNSNKKRKPLSKFEFKDKMLN